MKKYFVLSMAFVLVTMGAFAQDFEGVVTYSRVTDPSKRVSISGNSEGNRAFGQQANQEFMNRVRRPIYFTLAVKGNESVYKSGNNEVQETSVEMGGQRMSFRMPIPKDEIKINHSTNTVNSYQEFATQFFQVSGEISPKKWKLDPTSVKEILGYECMKATVSETTPTKMPRRDESGKTTMIDTTVTNNITVWFTDALPSSAGPEKFSGLPGLVLEVETNDGVTTYTATAIDKREVKADELKITTKGKKVSEKEFTKIKDDYMAEMMKNNGGGMRAGGFRQSIVIGH